MSSLHTISEHVEPDESLDLDSGVQRKHQTSRELQAQTRLTTGPTAQDPASVSPSDPAHHPVLHMSKVNLPPWLVNLMRDIEEATTHELTVE
ncbi:hypothetical protein R3I93_006625 [Phoxinus phoxinus]|uniref:Uncharacterized protein n=1 Tax=Phoxinus phoxinus TaxID=58324 RepID=A0AAN9D6E4_9TELE